MSATSPAVPADLLRAQTASILRAWGMRENDADLTAEVMIATDLWGIDSHGVAMLIMYDEMIAEGVLRPGARSHVVRETPVTALLDAGGGLGHAVSVRAMHLAVDKALASGVGAVCVRNSHHFGAAGYYARLAADRGAVGFVTTGSRVISVVPTRAAVPVMGTNPIAFAAPAERNDDFVLDMATSTVAANKVRAYALRGRALPEGWVTDGGGASIRDAAQAFDTIFHADRGGLTPVGGTAEMGSHKGYGLSVMAHILGAALSGGSFSPLRNRTGKPGDPDNIGHFFLAIDPRAFREAGAFQRDVDDVIDELHATAPIDPDEPVLVAGEPETRTREARLRDGVPIPSAFAEKLRAICARAKTPFLLEPYFSKGTENGT